MKRGEIELFLSFPSTTRSLLASTFPAPPKSSGIDYRAFQLPPHTRLPRYSPLSFFQALKSPQELSLRPPSTMCTSTATLLYGLWVTTASLAFAATAHHRTRSPFLAIDLILLRRRSGSLKVGSEGAKALVMIPPEVWEHIKQQMILIEALDVELQAIAPMRCRQCLKEDVLASLLDSIRLQPRAAYIAFGLKHKWSEWSSPDCEECCDNSYEADIDLLKAETVKVSAERQSGTFAFRKNCH